MLIGRFFQEVSMTESKLWTEFYSQTLDMIINGLFWGSGTILIIHIILNHKLNEANFQMTYSLAIYAGVYQAPRTLTRFLVWVLTQRLLN